MGAAAAWRRACRGWVTWGTWYGRRRRQFQLQRVEVIPVTAPGLLLVSFLFSSSLTDIQRYRVAAKLVSFLFPRKPSRVSRHLLLSLSRHERVISRGGVGARGVFFGPKRAAVESGTDQSLNSRKT
jgi:hypothetical protein